MRQSSSLAIVGVIEFDICVPMFVKKLLKVFAMVSHSHEISHSLGQWEVYLKFVKVFRTCQSALF
jgi:hypothetical protein